MVHIPTKFSITTHAYFSAYMWQVADLYGIRATLVDGGEIRGAGNAWICPEVLIYLEEVQLIVYINKLH